MTKHMRGAVALLRARGTSMFTDAESTALFRSVKNQMLIEAIQLRRPLEAFPGPRGWLSDFAEYDVSPQALLSEYTLEITGTLHRSSSLFSREVPSDTQTAIEINSLLEAVLAMQQKLVQWEADIPLEWYPKTAAISSQPLPGHGVEELEVWPGPLHAYSSADVSALRNHARVLQILCGDMINAARAWLNPREYYDDVDFQITRNKVQCLVDSICFSVPFHQWGHDLGECVRPLGQDKLSEFSYCLNCRGSILIYSQAAVSVALYSSCGRSRLLTALMAFLKLSVVGCADDCWPWRRSTVSNMLKSCLKGAIRLAFSYIRKLKETTTRQAARHR